MYQWHYFDKALSYLKLSYGERKSQISQQNWMQSLLITNGLILCPTVLYS